jgi:hypothetical protein
MPGLSPGYFFHVVSASGPVEDSVDGSNSQPLFPAAHPGSGASFSCTVVARRHEYLTGTKQLIKVKPALPEKFSHFCFC